MWTSNLFIFSLPFFYQALAFCHISKLYCCQHVNYLITLCSILQCYISNGWLLHSPSFSHDHLSGFSLFTLDQVCLLNVKLMQVIWPCRFSFDPNTKLGLDVASVSSQGIFSKCKGLISYLGESLYINFEWHRAYHVFSLFNLYICDDDIHYLNSSQCSR